MNITVPKKTMILFVGIQASGKTSFYRENFPDMVHVNLDELHTRNRERGLIDDCLDRGESFVVDNTNPTAKDRAGYIAKAKANRLTERKLRMTAVVSEAKAKRTEQSKIAQAERLIQ